MDIEIVKALLLLVRVCSAQINCDKCPIKEFCGKMPINW